MKKMLILLFVISILVLGCAGPVDVKKEPAKYSGFMELKAGQWAETVMKTSQGTVEMRVELIENSPDLSKYQIIMGDEETGEVMQIWMDRGTGEAVMYIIKTDEAVSCMEAGQAPKSYISSDDSAYPADKAGISHAKTEVAEKDVVIAKFIGESSEVWVSSDVPFGLVKIVSGGKTTLQLSDFGTIGAKNQIDPEDIEKCGGSIQATVDEEPTYEEDPAFVSADDYEYEEYIEEESASDNPAFVAKTVEHETAEDVNFDCSECYGMPPMAENACLASCR